MAEAQAPEITGQVYLYEQPELLTVKDHEGLGLSRIDGPFYFAREASVIPLNVNEFVEAAKHYPIVFSSGSDARPMAVTGLRKGENAFVDEQGQWAPGVYIPQYVARYPFIFARDDSSNRYALVIDRSAKMISDDPEFPFFQGNELSEQSNRILEFCKEYENQRVASDAFIRAVRDDYDLLTRREVNVPVSENNTRNLGEMVAVDEKKLRDLPEDAVLDLWKRNYLPFIYAHLMSQSNWRTLLERVATAEARPAGTAVN
jgi:hypothetical protein